MTRDERQQEMDRLMSVLQGTNAPALIQEDGVTRRVRRRGYQANRGGHAPGHLRDLWLEWLETYDPDHPHAFDAELANMGPGCTLDWLMGQLWNCTDGLPGWAVDSVEDMAGERLGSTTYAAAVRRLKPLFTE